MEIWWKIMKLYGIMIQFDEIYVTIMKYLVKYGRIVWIH